MSYKTEMPACGREPFTFDWEDFYALHGLSLVDDPITLSTWTVTGGSKGNEFVNGFDTTVFLLNGTLNGTILAHNTIEINGGTYRTCKTLAVEIV